jgi:hypothetical protein
MHHLSPIEDYEGMRLASSQDIGLYKLMACGHRTTYKDIYDLDLITDAISLPYLMQRLSEKLASIESHRKTIFDLDKSSTPLQSPELLLKFDDFKRINDLPMHSSVALDIVDGKSWTEVRSSWKAKVREYYRTINFRNTNKE